jgi:hypothetical protein
MQRGTAGTDSVVFGREHYAARASELEAAGERISDLSIRMSYLELARSFREMANLASLSPRPSEVDLDQAARPVFGPP